MEQPLWESLAVPQKIKQLSYDLAIPHLEYMRTGKRISTQKPEYDCSQQYYP